MRAVQAQRFAEPPTLVELPDPEPGPGEVLVDGLACAVGLTTRNMLWATLETILGSCPSSPVTSWSAPSPGSVPACPPAGWATG